MGGTREVAVKVQYPGALNTMLQDLTNIRLAAEFLQVQSPDLLLATGHTSTPGGTVSMLGDMPSSCRCALAV